ncbi:hypothetical protein ABET40_14575 [Metabacillus fastidiosus]
MSDETALKDYDVSIIYDYKEHPDIIAGRCDNCNCSLFASSISKGAYLRKCTNCGMTKSI